MTATRHSWLHRCPSCSFLTGDLLVQTLDDSARAAIDETQRADALRAIRAENFRRILDHLDPLRPAHQRRLLDIGSAHGWFLEEALKRGYPAEGIEPDPSVGVAARAKGLTVREGHFPQDLPQGQRYDLITFNDVLEHIPDTPRILKQCLDMLEPGGILAVNLPSSKGIFYRLADVLDRIGLGGPFRRMWQVDFASPHLVYMAPEHLIRLASQAGFRPRLSTTLPSVTWKGLWARLRYDRSAPVVTSALLWVAITLSLPALRLLPGDIAFVVFEKPDA